MQDLWRYGIIRYMRIVAWGFIFYFAIAQNAAATVPTVLFKDTFDTVTTVNKDIYDSQFSAHRIEKGSLVFFYPSTPDFEPNGIECTLPPVPTDPDERRIEMNFGGGGRPQGASVSNAVYI